MEIKKKTLNYYSFYDASVVYVASLLETKVLKAYISAFIWTPLKHMDSQYLLLNTMITWSGFLAQYLKTICISCKHSKTDFT